MQFVLTLPECTNLPVYKQVSESLRLAIVSGRLKPGEKLPSSRDLADSVNVSRFTVIRSYEELASQGYIQTITGSGTFVSNVVPKQFTDFIDDKFYGAPADQVSVNDAVELSPFGGSVMENESIEDSTAELFPELNYGAPSLEHLPLNRWREALNRNSRYNDRSSITYTSDPFGYRPLREAIAGYLIRSRSVRCTPEQVVIFSGCQSALDLVSRLLLRDGDQAAVEHPGFAGARRSLIMNGASLCPIAVDRQGLEVEKLNHAGDTVRLCYVTPSHHDPSGAIMSVERRRELLDWASRTGALIVEDDHDNEYRYGEKPVPSLQGMDEHDQVIYLSSFWKVLFPVVRLGFIVIPKRLVEVFWRAKSLIERDFPLLEQRALADFIQDGHLERHVRRMRSVYAKRRAAMIQALTKEFRKHVTICGTGSGMHLLVTFSPELQQHGLLRCARTAGLPLVSTGSHYIDGAKPGEFLIGFAHADEETIHESVALFAREILCASTAPEPLLRMPARETLTSSTEFTTHQLPHAVPSLV